MYYIPYTVYFMLQLTYHIPYTLYHIPHTIFPMVKTIYHTISGSQIRHTVDHTVRPQLAQSRSYLYTLGPKVGTIYILGAPGIYHIRIHLLGPYGAPESHKFTSSRQAARRSGQHTAWAVPAVYVYLYIYKYIHTYLYIHT